MIRSLSKVVVLASAAALFATLSALGIAANDKPDATVDFSGGTAAVGVGVTWGKGTLHFRGQDYPFKLQGLGVVDVGGGAIRGTGEVYNLKKVEDFAGNYAAASAGAALEKGESITTMRNPNGVVMRVKSGTKGAELKAALEGVTILMSPGGQ